MSRSHKKRRAVWRVFARIFFLLVLLSMLGAYISNQVTISSKQAELDELNEQIAQQQAENEENAADPQRRPRRGHRMGRAGLVRLCGAERADFCGYFGQLSAPQRFLEERTGVLYFGD